MHIKQQLIVIIWNILVVTYLFSDITLQT